MGYEATCKFCRTRYEIGWGTWDTTSFCSLDCQQKYNEMREEEEAAARTRDEAAREVEERWRDEDREEARQRREEAEERREEARQLREEAEERREEEREERRARIAEKEENRRNFLLNAAAEGDVEEVKRVLRSGVAPDFELDGKTPLIAALRNRKLEAAKTLLALGGADPNFCARNFSPLMICLFDSNTRGLDLLASTRGFRRRLESPQQVIWLWRSMSKPENEPDWPAIRAIFTDPALYPPEIRAGLERLVTQDEAARKNLLTYVDAAAVKDYLGIDVAEIQAELERVAESKRRAQEEEEEKNRKEAEETKRKEADERIDSTGINKLLASVEGPPSLKALPLIAIASFCFDRYIKDYKSVLPQKVEELGGRISSLKTNAEGQIPYSKFYKVWGKYCTEVEYIRWKNPARNQSRLPSVGIVCGAIAVTFLGFPAFNLWKSVFFGHHFFGPSSIRNVVDFLWLLVGGLFSLVYGLTGWAISGLMILGSIPLAVYFIKKRM